MDFPEWVPQGSMGVRILVVAVAAALAHVVVRVLRAGTERLAAGHVGTRWTKATTVATLVAGALTFTIYFATCGLILAEFGISIKTYFASATIIGLAVGFGSQGLVQDVVTGLTLVFGDLIEIGDMVEVGGQTGRVRSMGLRFTVLRNFMGADVYIPNRTINNVINYPRGYVRAYLDVRVPGDGSRLDEVRALVKQVTANGFEQFRGLFVTDPTVYDETRKSLDARVVRVKLRVWPGQTTQLESMRKELVDGLKGIDPAATDWMVTLGTEVEDKPGAAERAPRRRKVG